MSRSRLPKLPAGIPEIHFELPPDLENAVLDEGMNTGTA
jgi:hypothetical protein